MLLRRRNYSDCWNVIAHAPGNLRVISCDDCYIAGVYVCVCTSDAHTHANPHAPATTATSLFNDDFRSEET